MSRSRRFTLIVCVLLLGSCASNGVQDAYYSLSPGNPDYRADAQDVRRDARLTLQHITLPRFLGKQNLVMQSGAHALVSAQHHFWAEPLEDGISKVLVQEIMRASNKLQVERNTGRWTSTSNCSLRLEFDTFHATEAGQVLSSGRFWLHDKNDENPLVQTFGYTDDLQRDGYPQVVVQLRTSLQRVAKAIVTSIEQNDLCNQALTP